MNLPMSAPLPTAQPSVGSLPQKTAADYPQKLEDIVPGSKVLIGGQGVAEPFEAIVLATIPEHGPTAIPAIHVGYNNGADEAMITASGLYTVTVLVDGRDVAALMPAPKTAVTVRTRPRQAVAIQFKGGLESATEIISWAIGHGTFRYFGGDDQTGEHLTQVGIQSGDVWPGDWVLRNEDGRFDVVRDGAFGDEYEVLGS